MCVGGGVVGWGGGWGGGGGGGGGGVGKGKCALGRGLVLPPPGKC